MVLQKQNKEHNCVQTCLSMVSGRSVRFVEYLLGGYDGPTNTDALFIVCKKCKISIGKKWEKAVARYFLPLNCFVIVGFKEYKNYHMIVRSKGKFYDPNGTKYYRLPKRYVVTKYLVII